MRQSLLLSKTRKEAPSDEKAKNAELLIRAGYIHKEMAGVYTFLPLGLRVIEKIKQIIREEMNAIGGQELFLTALQESTLWEKTNRWSDEVVDNWFKTELKNGTKLGLGFTHEEPLTALMKNHIKSYKDLPKYAYQIQTKFRNELRAKSGIMRGREFLMKDLYSFSKNDEEHTLFYEKAKQAYVNVFNHVGLGEKTYITFASGGTFSKYSHEFQTLSEAGEDIVYVHDEKKIAINKEVYTDEVLKDLGVTKDELREEKAIEVGNIFSLGTKFSLPLGLTFVNEEGKNEPVIMGSYGIGLGRVMGTVVELSHDENGIIWPESIAPYQVHLISLCKDEANKAKAEELYTSMLHAGIDVLYDEREDKRPGEKFAESDLLGIPKRIIVSDKLFEENSVEYKNRNEEDLKKINEKDIIASLSR
ncbi:MAG: aminoacyl--tRNA ligase-related protein [Candidatus Magasanikbacteria bacterium]